MNNWERLKEKGFLILEDAMPNQCWFDEFYKVADELIDTMDEELTLEWRSAAQDWLKKNDNHDYFCGVPACYRDRTKQSGKRDKVYIQWIYELFLSEQFQATKVAKLPASKILGQYLLELQKRCSEHLQPLMEQLFQTYPDFKKRFHHDRPLPIVMKLVRYNYNENRFATNPHFDKSGISMLLNSNDEKVRWRIGEGNPCPLSSLHAPMEYPQDRETNHPILLIPGLFLQSAGIDVEPTPHCVLPVKNRRHRHSIIAFLMIPHTKNADTMMTDAPTVHDALFEVS